MGIPAVRIPVLVAASAVATDGGTLLQPPPRQRAAPRTAACSLTRLCTHHSP